MATSPIVGNRSVLELMITEENKQEREIPFLTLPFRGSVLVSISAFYSYLYLIDLNGRLYRNVVITNIKRKPKVTATATFRMLFSWLSGRRLAAPT